MKNFSYHQRLTKLKLKSHQYQLQLHNLHLYPVQSTASSNVDQFCGFWRRLDRLVNLLTTWSKAKFSTDCIDLLDCCQLLKCRSVSKTLNSLRLSATACLHMSVVLIRRDQLFKTRTHQEMRQQTSTFYDDMARTYFKILKKRTYFV